VQGVCFIDYDSAEAAEAAVKALQTNGVQAQMAKQQEQDSTNLYIANLPSDISEKDLETMFSSHGSVISTRILRDTNGASRGVGFARMETKENCEAVIQAYNGRFLPGSKESLTAKFADGGNKKKLQYKNQHWSDRPLENMAFNPFDHITFAPSELTPGLLTPLCGGYPRYAVTAPPLNNFHVPSPTGWIPSTGGWIPNLYFTQVMPTSIHHPSAAHADPTVLPAQLSAHMNQLQLSPQAYLPPGATTFIQMPYQPAAPLQAVTVEDW